MPVKNSIRVIVFAVLLGVVCSLILVGATLFTAPYREANERAEEVRNFLSALDVAVKQGADARELLDLFNRDIRVRDVGDLRFYEYAPRSTAGSAGEAVGVAVPFEGMGLWGPIKGVLALHPDLTTIRAVRFYQQEETPGLGGEIGARWFQQQFRDKRIVSEAGEPGFRILKAGAQTDSNSVDGITGASMTSDRVAGILDELAKRIDKERQNYGQ
jgi:Na+-transporting NADH:ubiquinone oxidoreductase subunit C